MLAPLLRGRHCFCSPCLHQHLWKGCSKQRQTPPLLRGGEEMWGIASQHFAEHGTSHVPTLSPRTILSTSPNPHFIVSNPVIITARCSSCEDYMAVTVLTKAEKECVMQWKHSANLSSSTARPRKPSACCEMFGLSLQDLNLRELLSCWSRQSSTTNNCQEDCY